MKWVKAYWIDSMYIVQFTYIQTWCAVKKKCAVYPRSLDPFYIVISMKWVKTAWTYSSWEYV